MKCQHCKTDPLLQPDFISPDYLVYDAESRNQEHPAWIWLNFKWFHLLLQGDAFSIKPDHMQVHSSQLIYNTSATFDLSQLLWAPALFRPFAAGAHAQSTAPDEHCLFRAASKSLTVCLLCLLRVCAFCCLPSLRTDSACLIGSYCLPW